MLNHDRGIDLLIQRRIPNSNDIALYLPGRLHKHLLLLFPTYFSVISGHIVLPLLNSRNPSWCVPPSTACIMSSPSLKAKCKLALKPVTYQIPNSNIPTCLGGLGTVHEWSWRAGGRRRSWI